MQKIGAFVCIWTLLLHIPALAHQTNETTTALVQPTQSPSQPTTSTKLLHVSLNISTSTCRSRTVNYITHRLPQQCLRTNRSTLPRSTAADGGEQTAATGTTAISDEAVPTGHSGPSPQVSSPGAVVSEPSGTATDNGYTATSVTVVVQVQSSSTSQAASESTPTVTEPELDSALDNANFLSFEEWKKQNLAKVGQSPENIGNRGANDPDRRIRRPIGLDNSLDSLGEDAELDLGFMGFGKSGESGQVSNGQATPINRPSTGSPGSKSQEAQTPGSRRKNPDAGTTCKERFNYASLDCAAAVRKTNAKCKNPISILVEKKDSYMINECRTPNKFVIVDLCDDILVDTVVLANYEFFSSIFRTFRVSVSDLYPVKLDEWKVLGTFEARNTRSVQAFAIEQPQIWARYLRIEFLTHYGAEYYCPVSLLRVHGTTMMQDYRHEDKLAREQVEPPEEVRVPMGEADTNFTADSGVAEQSISVGVPKDDDPDHKTAATQNEAASSSTGPVSETPAQATENSKDKEETAFSRNHHTVSASSKKDTQATQHREQDISQASGSASIPNSHANATSGRGDAKPPRSSSTPPTGAVTSGPIPPDPVSISSPPAASTTTKYAVPSNESMSGSPKVADNTHGSPPPKPPPSKQQQQQQQQQMSEHGKPSPTQQASPHPPNPTTQESFFKSLHKRLQMLEMNSTLSLQYIESQSRILRDAFSKVEKRQLSKTETFLGHLNNSVMAELKLYRQQYDQLWQSTVIELDNQREQYQRDLLAISSRLGMLADDLLFQKQMAVVQSTLLLLCLGLFLFSRSGLAHIELPLMQQMLNRTPSNLQPTFDSPPQSPLQSPPQSPPPAPSTRKSRKRKSRAQRQQQQKQQQQMAEQSPEPLRFSDGSANGNRSSPSILQYTPPTPVSEAEAEPERGLVRRSDLGIPSIIVREAPLARHLKSAAAMQAQQSKYTSSVNQQADDDEEEEEEEEEAAFYLETQSGPATPRGSRDSRPSWEAEVAVVDVDDDDEAEDDDEDGDGLID